MKIFDLNGTWQLSGGGYHVDAKVPGSVVSALLDAQLIPDPYYGTNEEDVQKLFDDDYTFSRTFTLTGEDLAYDRVFLRCDGLDTVCKISINGIFLASTDNMHCQYRFNARSHLRVGENTISLHFTSPVAYTEALDSPLGKPFASMRKAHCMFGWDWGIRLPDSGIWRDICLEFVDAGRLLDVKVHQIHLPDRVDVEVTTRAELFAGATLRVVLTDPEGDPVDEDSVPARSEVVRTLPVPNPRLWWPAGYGDQPLYGITVQLVLGSEVLDERTFSIGLRTVRLERDNGEYRFFVNNTPIFLKGANIIIEDAILSRTDSARWERLIDNAIRSHYNTLRVWGGAYYPPDEFFDLCDRHGILIYQDFMFACKFYWPSRDWVRSVREEITQNVIRLRNHPSLCQWCGNNEADFFYTAYTSAEEETRAFLIQFGKQPYSFFLRYMVKAMYNKVFLGFIPEIVKKFSPDVGYIHSSPSVGDKLGAASWFDYFDKGDSHYYHHPNGDAPYQKLGDVPIRFLSEFGFQSYPSLKTLREYLPAEELSPYSKSMLLHQKSTKGNETIELYLSRDFHLSDHFPHYVYLSQMMAGEILRYTIEHIRRTRDFSRGILIWQHNDCWPVVSWAGIDYAGRWKGPQYYTRRFFAPVFVSCKEEGGRAHVYLINDNLTPVTGTLRWTLRRGDSLLSSGEQELTLPAASTGVYAGVEIPAGSRNDLTLFCSFADETDALTRGSHLFVEQKEFAFTPVTVSAHLKRDERGYTLTLTADHFAKAVALDFDEGDAIFSDNFFDLEPGIPYTVTVAEGDLTDIFDSDSFRAHLTLTCVNHIAAPNSEGVPTLIWRNDT